MPLPERYLFWGILISSVASAILGYAQLVRQAPRARRWLIAAVAAMIALAVVMAVLYLHNARQLKDKRLSALFGKMPNLEKLESLNLPGLQFSFVAMWPNS